MDEVGWFLSILLFSPLLLRDLAAKDEVQHSDDFPYYVSPSITEYSAGGHIMAAVEGYIYIYVEVDKTVHESGRCYISPTVSHR